VEAEVHVDEVGARQLDVAERRRAAGDGLASLR
jgi:hypothetical protein